MAKKHRIRKSPTVLRVRREASSCIAPVRGRLFFRRRAQGLIGALDFFRIRCFFAIRGASVRLQAAWEVVRRGVRSLGRDVSREVMRQACGRDVCSEGKSMHAAILS